MPHLHRPIPALVLLLLATAFALPGRAPAADLRLEASSGFVIPVRVNGRTLRLRVDPGAEGRVVLNPAAARRAGLRRTVGPFGELVGTARVRGFWTENGMEIAGTRRRVRFAWFDLDVDDGADGLISPALLPYDAVELVRGAPAPGEAELHVPVRFSDSEGLLHPHTVSGAEIGVRFSLSATQSVANASAGALLADLNLGSWAGEPVPISAQFGLARPARPLTFGSPVQLGGFAFDRLLVRVRDDRTFDVPVDHDEIALAGDGERRRPPWLMLTIGRDRLSGCSRIRYDRAAQALELSCVSP